MPTSRSIADILGPTIVAMVAAEAGSSGIALTPPRELRDAPAGRVAASPVLCGSPARSFRRPEGARGRAGIDRTADRLGGWGECLKVCV